MLDEREFELINIIGAKLVSSQRDLSRHINLSLGTTNMLIRRLSAKGYIRITQLNQRKFKYILTQKGFSEKLRKSVKYTLKTIHSIELIKTRIKEVLAELYAKGEKDFIILGKSDFALLVEVAAKELGLQDCNITFTDSVPVGQNGSMLLICKEEAKVEFWQADRVVDLIGVVAQDHELIHQK